MNEDGGEDRMGIDRWSRALSWHAALREADEKDLTNSVGREWQDWYADAENRRVFDNMSRLLADRHLYRKRRRRRRAGLESDTYDLSVPITEWRGSQLRQEIRKQRSFRGRWGLLLSGGIGMATLAVLIILWIRPSGLSPQGRAVVYQTGVGGLKDVRLADGSSIILGGHTKLSVALSTGRRSVSVIEGQAWFKVTRNPEWPFVVTAGDGTITDIGTAFLVTRESDRVVVTVTEGVVEVTARQPTGLSLKVRQGLFSSPALTPIRVTRGEQVAISDTGALDPLKLTDTHAATAWTHGRLTFDNQPLRYVVETVNRYSSRRIVVSPSAGTLRFSGIVFDDDIADWLQSLEVIFPVTVEERTANVLIQTRHTIVTISDLPPKKQP